MIKPTDEQIDKALLAAVSAIYFDDSSDYKSALYEVINNLAGREFRNLVLSDPRVAFKQLKKD